MKTSRYLLAALLLAPTLALANPNLNGVWKSSADAKALSGVMELHQDGSAKLAPEGYAPLVGTWRTEGKKLILDMPPHGISAMNYVLKKGELKLTYDNGSQQVFVQQVKKKDTK